MNRIVVRSSEVEEQSSNGNNPLAVRLENELKAAFAEIPEMAYQMYKDSKAQEEHLSLTAMCVGSVGY